MKYQESAYTSWNDSVVQNLPAKIKDLLIPAKTLQKWKLNFSLSALFYMKTTVSLKYFVNDCLWKHFLKSNSPQTHSISISLTILVTLRPLTRV